MTQALTECCKQRSGCQARLKYLFHFILSQWLRLGACNDLQALADILYTFAILNVDAQHMTDSILERIVYDLKSMSPASLSQLVSGLHLLNHRYWRSCICLPCCLHPLIGLQLR